MSNNTIKQILKGKEIIHCVFWKSNGFYLGKGSCTFKKHLKLSCNGLDSPQDCPCRWEVKTK